MTKILVIRLSSIGDLVLCTPAIRCIAQQMNAEVHLLTKRSFANVLTASPHIHKQWIYEDEEQLQYVGLQNEEFDQVFDMHKNWRSLRVSRALKCPRLTFDKVNVEKWLHVQFKWKVLPDLHLVERYFDALRAWGVKDDGQGLEYNNLEEIGDFDHRNYMVVVLGAAHATKQIPSNIIHEILEHVEQKVILIGGPGERAEGKEIASRYGEEVLSYAGGTNLQQSAYIISKADVVITPDTGMMHIAAALQKPIRVVWGNTVPEFGMYPYYGSASDVEYINYEIKLPCRPCSKIGSEACPKGHFKCMLMQNGESIACGE